MGQDRPSPNAGDDRPYLYTFEELETANTHDPLWNATQHQLRQEGIIHNYLRMLWGKKNSGMVSRPPNRHGLDDCLERSMGS